MSNEVGGHDFFPLLFLLSFQDDFSIQLILIHLRLQHHFCNK